MEMMDVNKLIPHKMNEYLFDDIKDEAWRAFIESIETSGIIEPIIVTQDLVIVSGHQRTRAAKELGIKKVAVEMRNYDSEDEILKQLIETNIRQRGIGNVNPVKFGRCIAELERIYGIKNGGDRKSESHNVNLVSQSDLAEQLNMSKMQLSRYKSLTDLIPELQDAVQSGKITATTAMGFVKKLSAEEQEQLAEQIRGKEKVSSQEIKFYKERIQKLSDENKALRNQEPEVIEKEVEVVPDDYEQVKKDLERAKADNSRIEKERQAYLDSLNKAKDRLAEYENPSSEKKAQMHLEEDAESFIIGTYNYIKRNGGFVWVTEKMDNLPEEKANEFKQAVMAIDAFAKQMIENIGGYQIG